MCNGETWRDLKNGERQREGLKPYEEGELDVNFTHWDVSVRHVDVGLSLWRWLDGEFLRIWLFRNG